MKKAVKILCVEDDFDIRANISEILRDEGYEVFEADNGDSGFKKYLEVKPDLIISDLMMFQFDGFYLLAKIREEKSVFDKNVPFIFLSALGNQKDLEKARNLRCDDYLLKPIDFDLLVTKIEKKTRNASLVKIHQQIGLKNQPESNSLEFQSGRIFIHLSLAANLLQNLQERISDKLDANDRQEISKIYSQIEKIDNLLIKNNQSSLIGKFSKESLLQSSLESGIEIFEFLQSLSVEFEKNNFGKISIDKNYQLTEMPKILIPLESFKKLTFEFLLAPAKNLTKFDWEVGFYIDQSGEFSFIFRLNSEQSELAEIIDETELMRIFSIFGCEFALAKSVNNAAIISFPAVILSN